MRTLLDECIVAGLETHFTRLEAVTAKVAGTLGLENGKLLKFADEHYEVFITVDKNLPFQQNLRNLQLRLVLVRTFDTRLAAMAALVPAIENAAFLATPGDFVIVDQSLL